MAGVEEDSIIDPELMTSLTKVKTEFYMGQLADRCSKLGIYQHIDPLPYRNAIKQLEILAVGSDRLTQKERGEKKGEFKKNYFEEKKDLEEERDKKLEKALKDYNPKLKHSRLNAIAEHEKAEIEKEFDKNLHMLLMKFLAPVFWEKETIEII